MESLEDILAHHGIKGMKWGVRRSNPSGGGKAPSTKLSSDAKKAHAAKAVVKTHGTHALSNQELQHLVKRMNLEQQYSRLSSTQTSQGAKVAKEILTSFGKQQATALLLKGAANAPKLLKK